MSQGRALSPSHPRTRTRRESSRSTPSNPARITSGSSRPSLQGREASPGSGSTTRALPTYYPGTIEPEAALQVAARAGEASDVGDIRLQFAAAFRVAGVVVDDAGRPVEGVRVRLVPADASPGALPMTRTMGRTDANGEFALSARGSVAAETVAGTTRQFRDELATTVAVDVTFGSLSDVRIIVKRP